MSKRYTGLVLEQHRTVATHLHLAGRHLSAAFDIACKGYGKSSPIMRAMWSVVRLQRFARIRMRLESAMHMEHRETTAPDSPDARLYFGRKDA